jgi:proteasome lid subunit RPN8/RPN11
VSAREGEAIEVLRARNIHASPLRYEFDPAEQYRLMAGIEDEGLDLGLIYHSHTRSDPVPSQTDVNMAQLKGHPAFPGTLYLIVGVKGEVDDVRLWSIVGDEVAQLELQVKG